MARTTSSRMGRTVPRPPSGARLPGKGGFRHTRNSPPTGLCCNRFHPDRANSFDVEELRSRVKDALAGARAVRGPLPEGLEMRLPIGLGDLGHLQSLIDKRVTGQYHSTCFW